MCKANRAALGFVWTLDNLGHGWSVGLGVIRRLRLAHAVRRMRRVFRLPRLDPSNFDGRSWRDPSQPFLQESTWYQCFCTGSRTSEQASTRCFMVVVVVVIMLGGSKSLSVAWAMTGASHRNVSHLQGMRTLRRDLAQRSSNNSRGRLLPFF